MSVLSSEARVRTGLPRVLVVMGSALILVILFNEGVPSALRGGVRCDVGLEALNATAAVGGTPDDPMLMPEVSCISKHRTYFGLEEYSWDESWKISENRTKVFLGKGPTLSWFEQSATFKNWRSRGKIFSCGDVEMKRLTFSMDPKGRTVAVACLTDSGDDWGPRPRLVTYVLEQGTWKGHWLSQPVLSISGRSCNQLGILLELSRDGRVLTLRYHEWLRGRRLDYTPGSSGPECRLVGRRFEKSALGFWEEDFTYV